MPIGLGDEGFDGSISVRTEVSSCLGGDGDVTLQHRPSDRNRALARARLTRALS
jgi:hypothetical protein